MRTMDQEDEAQAAARLLLQSRACGQLLAALPEACAPRTAAAAIAIQRRTMAELGTIGGWKVGATGPDATTDMCAHACVRHPPYARHAGRGAFPLAVRRVGNRLPAGPRPAAARPALRRRGGDGRNRKLPSGHRAGAVALRRPRLGGSARQPGRSHPARRLRLRRTHRGLADPRFRHPLASNRPSRAARCGPAPAIPPAT